MIPLIHSASFRSYFFEIKEKKYHVPPGSHRETFFLDLTIEAQKHIVNQTDKGNFSPNTIPLIVNTVVG